MIENIVNPLTCYTQSEEDMNTSEVILNFKENSEEMTVNQEDIQCEIIEIESYSENKNKSEIETKKSKKYAMYSSEIKSQCVELVIQINFYK
jgi:hypothetical protein